MTIYEIEVRIGNEIYFGEMEIFPANSFPSPLPDYDKPLIEGFGRYGRKLVAGWHFDRHLDMKPTYSHEIRGKPNPKSNPRHHSTRERLMHRMARRDISKFLA